MTISMAFPASNKGGPLDLSAADCPKLLKPGDVTSEDELLPPNLHDDKPSTSTHENDKKRITGSPKSICDSGTKSDDVSNQLKTLTEIFKTLASVPNGTSDTAAASLLEMFAKKSDSGTSSDALSAPGSLEALHQLGWQLISLGRGSGSIAPSTSQPVQSAAAPMWVPSRPTVSRQPAQHPPSLNPSTHPPPQTTSMSGISMRGNQKYSAFYQHNRKQAIDEGGDTMRQSSVSQVQRTAIPTQTPSRRISGPTSASGGHPRPYFGSPIEATMKPSLGRISTEVTSSTPTRSRETAFLCSCGQDFDSLYVFTLHMKDTGHKPRSSQPERDIPKLVRGQDMWINSETEQTREILRCMRCNQSFRSLPELTMHMMKTSHYSEIVYSDAGRNLLASQTMSSVGDRGRSGMSNNWAGSKGSGAPVKRSVRLSGHPQNGSTPTAPVEPPRSNENPKMNGQSVEPMQFETAAKREEVHRNPPKCERPASSHELHAIKPSPKPATSPDAVSCPSELQRSAASSPRNETEKPEHKHLHSPFSGRGNGSPRGSTTDEKTCSDSVIRQIESFVEKSLPFPTMASPTRPSWQPRAPHNFQKAGFPRPNLSPLTETETSRSTPEKPSQRKRRFSSGSSASTAAPTVTTPTETSAEKRPSLSFSLDDGNAENPLSSLQKLVETTHQGGGSAMSPPRQFGLSGDNTATIAHATSGDVEMAPAVNSIKLPGSSPSPLSSISQPNIATALSVLQNFMSKVSTHPQQQQQQPRHQEASQNGDNDPQLPNNWMGLLTAMLNAAKQSEQDVKRPDTVSESLSSSPKQMFGQLSSVFPGAAFDKPLSLPAHMSSPPIGSPGMVANITKKAKCHFCGKPFANKGQVRLHISKNKCPCLLQQSAAAAMVKPLLNAPSVSTASSSSQPGDKRPMAFPYPGFQQHHNPSPLGAHDLSRLFASQQPNDPKPVETALLRHFNQPQPNRPASISTPKQQMDLIASLARAASEGNPQAVSAAGASNPLFSLLFPTTPAPIQAPQPAPLESSSPGMTAEQKALFLFAQAMASLATGVTPHQNKPAEVAPPVNLLTNFIQSFNVPLTLPPVNLVPAVSTDSGSMNPEVLGSYMTAIRQIAAMGGMPPPQAANNKLAAEKDNLPPNS